MIDDDLYQQILSDKRKLDTMRHVKTRQKYINELGEEEGKKAFFDSLQKARGFFGEKNYQELILDMKIILRGGNNEF